jgi:hypothetical protein
VLALSLLWALAGEAPAATGGPAGRESRSEEGAAPDFLEPWDWWFPGYFKVRDPYPRRLSGPLAAGNNNFLHHLVLLPPMEGFRIIRPGRFGFDARFEAVRSSRTGDDPENRFDAFFYESVTSLAFGLTRDLEVRAGFNVAYFRPDGRDSVRITQGGEVVLPPEDFETRPGVGDILLGVKVLSAFEPKDHLGLSTVLTLKIPVGKRDFLTTGRGDAAVTFCGTWRIALGDGHHLFGHLNAGVVFFDEENVFPRKVYLSASSVYGGALVFPVKADRCFLGTPLALVLQVQGHSNVFRKLDILNSDPATLRGGVRVGLGDWTFEAGGGFGLNKTGAPDWVLNAAVGSDF